MPAEGAVIALTGGCLGLALAGLFDGLSRHALGLPQVNSAGLLELRSLIIACSAIAFVTLVGTAFPVWHVLQLAERGGPLNTSEGTTRGWGAHRLVLSGQIAVVFSLLICAGLFLRSLQAGLGRGIGVDVDGLAVAELSPAVPGRLRAPLAWTSARGLLDEIRSVPGVRQVALSSSLSLSSLTMIRVRADGLSEAVAQGTRGPFVTAVSEEYLATVGTRLLEGRAIGAGDVEGSELVVLIGRTMASRVWPLGALGNCLDIGPDPFRCHRVVGVVEDIPGAALRESATMQFYVPAAQHPELMTHPYLFVRFDERSLQISAIEPLLGPSSNSSVRLKPFAELLEPELRPWRIASRVVGVYGALALILAGTGLYAVMAFSAQQRGKEFAVRLALGASPGDVSWLMVRDALASTLVGILVGFGLLVIAKPHLAGLLFRIQVFDPASVGLAAGVLLVATVMSVAGPVLSARRTDIRQILATE